MPEMKSVYTQPTIGPDTKPNYPYHTQNENLSGDMDPYFEPQDLPVGGLLRKVLGKVLGMSALPMMMGKIGASQPRNVVKGMFQPYDRRNFQLRKKNLPFIYGDINDVNVTPQAPMSVFYNPKTGKVAVADIEHQHHALGNAVNKKIKAGPEEDLFNDYNYGRLRFEVGDGGKNVVDIRPPVVDDTGNISKNINLERSGYNLLFDAMVKAGLITPETRVNPKFLWNEFRTWRD